jgi:hypothetical protein
MHVMSTATQGDGSASLQYNWTAIDALWDGVMKAGVTAPIVELSYMPSAIASKPFIYTHYYKGLSSMPREWSLWYDLIHAFGEHVVERYGEDVVARWRFEVSSLRADLGHFDLPTAVAYPLSSGLSLVRCCYFAVSNVRSRAGVERDGLWRNLHAPLQRFVPCS